MKCEKCNQDFSDKVYDIHIIRCKKSIKDIVNDTVKEIKKELKKDGKKSKKVK